MSLGVIAFCSNGVNSLLLTSFLIDGTAQIVRRSSNTLIDLGGDEGRGCI